MSCSSVRKPELRDESREADEQRGVEKAFAAEPRVASVSDVAKPELDEQRARRVDVQR